MKPTGPSKSIALLRARETRRDRRAPIIEPDGTAMTPTGITHELKTDPGVFADVLIGAKTFEIRFNDRNFQVGDTLRLMETEHDGAEMLNGAPLIYTGYEVTKTISHVLTGYGLADGWCCLSFVNSDLADFQQATHCGTAKEFRQMQADKPKSQTEWDRVYGLIHYWAERARVREAACQAALDALSGLPDDVVMGDHPIFGTLRAALGEAKPPVQSKEQP